MQTIVNVLSLAQTPPVASKAVNQLPGILAQTLVIFVVAIILLYVIVLFAARKLRPGSANIRNDGGIEIAAARPLEPGRTLYIIRLRGREWLVASGERGCETIAEVTVPPFTSLLNNTPAPKKPEPSPGVTPV